MTKAKHTPEFSPANGTTALMGIVESDAQLIIRQMNEIGRLTKQNSELVEALKEVQAWMRDPFGWEADHNPGILLPRLIREAIAKVEGGAQ